MSYEGFSQFLCKNGHHWKIDCNELMWNDIKQKCPVCNEVEVWENMVNTTNGSWDDDGRRIDGFVDLKFRSKTNGYCSACGEEHVCEERFEIPKKSKGCGKMVGFSQERDFHCGDDNWLCPECKGCGKELGNCKCGEPCNICDGIIHLCPACKKEDK